MKRILSVFVLAFSLSAFATDPAPAGEMKAGETKEAAPHAKKGKKDASKEGEKKVEGEKKAETK
jgi:hypothetical protein